MSLPADAFSYRLAGGVVTPRWLGEIDEDFVSSVLIATARFDGLTVGEAALAADHALPNRMAHGLWSLTRRRWSADIDAPVSPEDLRAVVFELAANLPRSEALREAAATFGIAPAAVPACLFADRASRRRLRAAKPESVAKVTARYNLAVIQTLLARAMDVEAWFAGDPRAVVRAARRDGLVVHVEATPEDRVRIGITGPLALFHDSAKYGRRLARFLPSLVAGEGWSLRARVLVSGEHAELRLAASDGVSFAGTIAAAATEPVLRRLAKGLRVCGAVVDVAPPVLRAGERLVVLDLGLMVDGHRVYVDVLPFATAPHLEEKLALAAQLDAPMILCVEASSVPEAVSTRVVRYRRAVDPRSLVAAVRALISENAA